VRVRVAPGARYPTDAMKLWYAVEHHLARGVLLSAQTKKNQDRLIDPFHVFGVEIYGCIEAVITTAGRGLPALGAGERPYFSTYFGFVLPPLRSPPRRLHLFVEYLARNFPDGYCAWLLSSRSRSSALRRAQTLQRPQLAQQPIAARSRAGVRSGRKRRASCSCA